MSLIFELNASANVLYLLKYPLLRMCVCCILASSRITRSGSCKMDFSFLRWFCHIYGMKSPNTIVDVTYAAPQAHRIVNVALHKEYPPGIIFVLSHGKQ
jgi:hypothetical protein